MKTKLTEDTEDSWADCITSRSVFFFCFVFVFFFNFLFANLVIFLLLFCNSRDLCGYQRPARGGSPPGNLRGTHGLGKGFVAKMFPGDRGISALSHFLANLPGDLPTGFAKCLLSRSSAVILISREAVTWQNSPGMYTRDSHIVCYHEVQR